MLSIRLEFSPYDIDRHPEALADREHGDGDTGRGRTTEQICAAELNKPDLSRISAVPRARSSHFPFEDDWAFPARCRVPSAWIAKAVDGFKDRHLGLSSGVDDGRQISSALVVLNDVSTAALS